MWSKKEISYLTNNIGKQSYSKIALKLNKSFGQVRYQSNKFQLNQQYTRHELCKILNIKYSLNKNYFSVPNLENSYWAGFIAADGCIHEKSPTSSLGIYLSIKDKNHLIKFKDTMQYSGPLYQSKNKRFIQFKAGNNQIVYDLYKHFNITPRKSLTLQPPNIASNKYIKAFLIGNLDGDGCISKDVAGRPVLQFLSASKKFIIWVKKQCDNINGKTKNNIQTIHANHPTWSPVYSYRITGKYGQKLYDTLNKVNVPKLSRKWRL